MALSSDDVHITVQSRAYNAQVTFNVTASVDQVTAVLTDYEHPNRLTPDARLVTSIDNGGSHIQYESVIEPDFFIRKRLQQQIFATTENLAREAARGGQILSLTRTDNRLGP
jgi:hypothetical protein